MNELIFTTIAEAKRLTNLSYLGGVNVSQKIIKSQKVDAVLTYCLYLAPAKTSGYQVCPYSTPECRTGCLATSGRARIELQGGITMIQNCRINKTKLFFEQQTFFMDWLIAELNMYKRKATNKNMGFAVRLNGTSDIDWVNVKHNGKNIFEIFPDVQFYDYTKQYTKFNSRPTNYHLTLSYTGNNWTECMNLLNAGINVAMIFNVPNHMPLPTKFGGYTVLNGDITDLRIKDQQGIIVGLHWKNIADKKANVRIKESKFVIQPNDERIGK